MLSQPPEWSDQKIADQASEALEMDNHRTGVARIRVSNSSAANDDVIFSKDRLLELSHIAAQIDHEKNDPRQLELNFQSAEQFQPKKEQLEQLEPLHSTNNTEQNLFSIGNGLKSIESLKLVNPQDFGCLLDRE